MPPLPRTPPAGTPVVTRALGLIVAIVATLGGTATAQLHRRDDIDRAVAHLDGFGLLPDAILDQRPFADRELLRLADAAEERARTLPDDERRAVARSIAVLRRVAGLAPGETTTEVVVEQVVLDEGPRPIPDETGVGRIDGVVQPLTDFRGGRPYVQGLQSFTGVIVRARPLARVVLTASPTLRLGAGAPGRQSDPRLVVEELQAAVALGNWELSVGRAPVVFGPGRDGGMLLSTNARALDRILFGTAHPVTQPGFLRHLGPTRTTVAVATMGPDREFPWSALVAFAIASRPTRDLELALHHTYLIGGYGSPDFFPWQPLSDFLFIRGEGLTGDNRINPTDHRLGGSLRLRFPALRGAVFFLEGAVDDLDLEYPVRSMIDVGGGHLGIELPRLDRLGNHALRLDVRVYATMYGRNSTFVSGQQLDGRPLAGGGASDALDVALTWDGTLTERDDVRIAVGAAIRDSDLYRFDKPAGGFFTQVHVVEARPAERGLRAAARWDRRFGAHARARFLVSAETVESFAFVPGNDRLVVFAGWEVLFAYDAPPPAAR